MGISDFIKITNSPSKSKPAAPQGMPALQKAPPSSGQPMPQKQIIALALIGFGLVLVGVAIFLW